jgi:hypothetical protein
MSFTEKLQVLAGSVVLVIPAAFVVVVVPNCLSNFSTLGTKRR